MLFILIVRLTMLSHANTYKPFFQMALPRLILDTYNLTNTLLQLTTSALLHFCIKCHGKCINYAVHFPMGNSVGLLLDEAI